jgi:hypothetical protein
MGAASSPGRKSRTRVAFITANLNAGGAQRSLVHLACGLQADFRVEVCVTHPITSRYFLDELRRAGVPAYRLCASTSAFDIAEAFLASGHCRKSSASGTPIRG